MKSIETSTIINSLSRLEQELRDKVLEVQKKGDMKEALRLQSRREGVKMSIVTIKHLIGRIEII